MKRKTTFLTSLFAIVLGALFIYGTSVPVNAQQAKSSNETVLVDLHDYPSGGNQTSYYRGNLNEGFEGTTFPPLGWKVINGGDANAWVRYTTTPIAGAASAAITYNSSVAHDDWLITPQLAPSADNYTISFKAKNQSTSYIELFNVKLSTTGNNAEDFTVVLAENVGPGTTAVDYSFDLSAYIGQQVYVGIQAISLDMYRLYVDEFTGPAIVLGPANLVVNGLNKTYSKIPETLLPASMQLAASVFNTGSVLNDATNVSFGVAEAGFSSTGAIVVPLENGVSQTVNAASSWNTSNLALGTYNILYEALHPTSNVDDRTDNFALEVTETVYSRDAGVVAGGVGSNTAAITFGMPFDIPTNTLFSGVQVQWPATFAAADLTFNFAIYEVDASNAVLSTVYTSGDVVRTQAMQGTTVDFTLDAVALPAGKYMLAVKQLGNVNVAMGYDMKSYGALYIGDVAAAPAAFSPNTSFGNLTMRMLINPSTAVVVYPKPRNLAVADAGMAAQLTWQAPLLNNKMPAGFGEDNSIQYRSNFNQPAFDQITEGRDEGVFIPKGSKSLATRDALYDNGPFINAPGGGPSGADGSVLQNTDLGMNTLGAGIQFTAGNRMADDFVVTDTWNVESFTFYAYQTGSTTTSTMTGGYLQIWDGDPTAGGQVIYGDLTTNVMSETAWTNTYRYSQTAVGTTRPIMSITCATPGLTLQPGTYWVDYTLAGSLASGPWAPPITINGQAVTGNAKQYLGSSSAWADFLDSGTGTPAQGVPFLVTGTTGSGGGPVNGVLLGYNLSKNGTLLTTLGADALSYLDTPLAAGTYNYSLTAVYGDPYPGESDPVDASITIFSSTAGYPFSESFEGDFPGSWDVYNVDGLSPVWVSSTAQNHTSGGAKSAFHNYGPSTQTEDGWLVSPQIIIPAGTTPELRFWDYNSFPTYYGKNSVLISAASGNPASGDFTEVWTVASVPNPSAWTEEVINLAAYAGQNIYIAFRYEGSDAHGWYVDDVALADGAAAVPTISVDPLSMTETHLVPPSQTTTQVLTISNTGGVDLTWEMSVNTGGTKASVNTPADYARLRERMLADGVAVIGNKGGVNGGVSPNMTRDEVIRYDDGTNYDAIGLTSGGTFQVAAYFTAAEMGQYAGMKLNQVEIYINDVPSPCVLKVYGAGTPTSPGALLHEQTISPTAMSWNMITLDNQVDITGQDLWIGYEVTHAGGLYPAGCDAGPAVAGFGDMISTDGVVWEPLSGYGLNYNWNIAGYLVPGITYTNDVGVFSLVSPTSGANLGDETVTVRVKNFGTAAQSNISVSYTLDGGTAVTGTIAGPLAGGETYDYTFAGTVNLGTVGQTYVFNACATVAGDENTVNDCKNYSVTNVMPVYCDATTSTEDEYIGNVLFGTINNTSGWQGGVADYTAQYTVIESGMSESITVTNPVPYSSDKVTVWVDWNQDYTYATGGDEEYVLTNDGTGATFTGAIMVPAGTAEGMYRMRVRMTYSTAPTPCGNSTYGEVEEYSIQVGAGVPPTPWLSADVLSGTIPAGGSTQVTVSFNSENLALGTYNGSLVITSNDPVNGTVTVPVTFNVEESDVCYPSPRNLTGTTQGQDVTLSWQAPDFTGGGGGGTTQDFVEGFEAGTLPTGWVTYNVDGDAYDWENTAVTYSTFPAHTGLYCMTSASYINGVGALTPNNWLVTPALAVTAESDLHFWVSAQDPNWAAEQYYVKVSTTGNSVADFTTTLHDAISGTAWEEVVVDLSAYAGQTIYLAFQHADVTDMYFIKIDDVTVTATSTKAAYTASVAPGTEKAISFKTAGMSQSEIDARLNPSYAYTFGASAETTTTGGAAQIVPSGIKHMSGSRNRALLYDNGPFINSPGTGPNGTDQSILQNVTMGMNTLDAGIQFASGNHMADDFVVDATWTVESFTFYGYQTGSPTTSTMTGGYLRIWDGDPTQGGQVIWGDLTTNLMSSTAWTNSYRLSEGTPGTTRPIMSITCATTGLTLEPGTYWVEYTLNGSLASGPWAPPITINGQGATGNAKQYLGSTSEWVDFLDSGADAYPQGLPFLIEGTAGGGGGECPHGELLGYNVYRDGSKIGETVASVRTYVDSNVTPGTYNYGVTAVYGDPYPGESAPVTTSVTVSQSAVFPFEEMWTSNSFVTNGWTFDPSQGNWAMSTMGNPAPSAQFGWSPSTTDYSFALVSKDIAAAQAIDNVTLQFDISLDDYSNTGAEYMKVYVWNGTAWVLVDTFASGSDIPWTTKSYDVTAHALGHMTKVKFEATGATTFDIDYWYIDNIKVFDGDPVLNPNITVTPAAMQNWVPMGGSQSQPMTIGNTGEGPLNWTASIQYLTRMETAPVAVPGGPKVEQGVLEFSQAGAQPGGAPQTDTRDVVVLNYDGDNFDAIGLTSGGSFLVAARFPSDMVSPYAGYNMESVDVYINNVPTNSTLKIWGAGSNNAPGALLYEQAFTGSEASWVTVTLNSSVALTGEDIWVGYSVEHAGGAYPAGCDAGPANPNGDWISTDGATWEHLAGYGLNYNWNIRALINGDSYTWLSLGTTSGTVAPGASQVVTALANSTGLGAGSYYANVRIASNDPDTPVKVVPTELHVGVGLNESDMSGISVYPVPASSQLTVELVPGVKTLRVLNYMGQVVSETSVSDELKHQLNVSDLRSGAYTLQFVNDKGEIYNKTVIINR